ncbi:branched-chain amino acid ABC transporter permease [Allonocardiopsis opalescens]|nr:branched-chain amino acid ABC transporter permease [Allonocardiopsis opalescens]
MDFLTVLSDALRGAVGVEAIVYVMAAIGLNLHFGYAGLLNFGQVGFMLVGMYGVAISVGTFELPLWVGLLVGIGLAVVLALLLGIPTLRLRSDYLAISTIAAGEILRLTFGSRVFEDITGGVYGLQGIAQEFRDANPLPDMTYGVPGVLAFTHRDAWVLLVGWLVVALLLVVSWLLIHSPWGRVVKGIREDEDAVRSLGKNVYLYKMQVLVLGGVFGALAGAVWILHLGNVQHTYFMPIVTFMLWAGMILGGPGRILGPVLGMVILQFFLTGMDSLLREAIGSGVIPADTLSSSAVGSIRFVLVGVVLMALMVFRPQGILGSRKEMLVNVQR